MTLAGPELLLIFIVFWLIIAVIAGLLFGKLMKRR